MERSQDRLALIELLERDGSVRRAVPVGHWPVSLGRAFDNDVVIDDPHVAAHHCSIEAGEAEGTLVIRVGSTRNGVQVGPRTLVEGESSPLPAGGETWQIGATRLRVRLPGDPVEPEKPLGLAATGAKPWTTAAAALALWALVLIEHGIDLDPGSSLTDWLVPLLAFPIALGGWCLVWAVGSKLFQHRFEFWAHFSVLSKSLLAVALLDLLLPLLGFALSWEWVSRITPVAAVLVLATMLYRHGALVVTFKHRWLVGGIGACLLVAGLVLGTLNYQRSDRVFGELYLSTLAPPAFRLAPGVSTKEYVGETAPLKERLDRRAAEDDHDGDDD